MEQMRELTHPGNEQLAAFWTGDLSPEALERLAAHLDICPTCEARLEEIEPASTQYRRCLELVHSRVPRSARGDADLRRRMEEIDARRAPRKPMVWGNARRTAWLSGIAASLAGLAILISPRFGGSELRADTLLAQAAVSAAQAPSNHRLRIRTRSASFVRPAVLRTGAEENRDEAALRERFTAAHYDWRDPLSPRSNSEWRHTLKHRTSKLWTDHDDKGQPEQVVETETDDGALRDASLTLDAKLLPVSGRFRFADQEWAEITAEPVPATESLPAPSALPARPVPPQAAQSSEPLEPLAERELSVRLAIDALHTEAGEPIEVSVEPTGNIQVTTYHLAPELETQLQASLDQIPGVALRSAANQPQSMAPRFAEPLDRITHASQDVAFEAHLLADLATRFDPAAEATLSAYSRTKLWDLRMKHSVQMNRDLANLRRGLEQERPGFRAASSDSSDGPQIQILADSATAVDRLITVLYAGAEPGADPAPTWRQLEAEFGRLQGLAGSYSHYLEQHRKELQ